MGKEGSLRGVTRGLGVSGGPPHLDTLYEGTERQLSSTTVSVQWVFIFFFGIFSECRDMLFTKKNMYIQSTIKVFIYKETVINISAFSVNTISCDFLFNSLSKCSTKLGFILCDQGDVV